jgi:hypothetical protein
MTTYSLTPAGGRVLKNCKFLSKATVSAATAHISLIDDSGNIILRAVTRICAFLRGADSGNPSFCPSFGLHILEN